MTNSIPLPGFSDWIRHPPPQNAAPVRTTRASKQGNTYPLNLKVIPLSSEFVPHLVTISSQISSDQLDIDTLIQFLRIKLLCNQLIGIRASPRSEKPVSRSAVDRTASSLNLSASYSSSNYPRSHPRTTICSKKTLSFWYCIGAWSSRVGGTHPNLSKHENTIFLRNGQ